MATITDEQAAAIMRQRAAMRLFAITGDPTQPGYGDAFMRTYLPHYSTHPQTGVYVPPAHWHGEFDHQVYGSLGQGVRKPFLAPRGFAKSTKVSLATPLICLARGLKKYALLIQETNPQAKQAMSQIIHELDNNDRLIQDFPGLKRAYVNGRPVADRDDDIAFANGGRLQALGAGGSLRGRRNQEQRPDLILIDDLENDEAVRTEYQRDKLDDWVSSALMGALAPGADVYMVGTLLHHDAVLARLMTRWGGYRYDALYDLAAFNEFSAACETAFQTIGGEWEINRIMQHVDPLIIAAAAGSSTWPGWWPAPRLATAKHDMGAAAFSRELLHEPISDEDKVFPRTRFRHRNMRSRLLASDGSEFRGVRLRCIVDPAVGEKVTNDYTAIAVVAQVNDAEYDVLDVWQGRMKQQGLIDRCKHFDHVWKRWHPVWVVESVAAQAWLAQALRAERLSVREVRPTRDKLMRAEPVGVLYENGQVYHDEALKDGDFELQMHQFPVAQHDDMVDAVVYGITELAHAPRARVTRL